MSDISITNQLQNPAIKLPPSEIVIGSVNDPSKISLLQKQINADLLDAARSIDRLVKSESLFNCSSWYSNPRIPILERAVERLQLSELNCKLLALGEMTRIAFFIPQLYKDLVEVNFESIKYADSIFTDQISFERKEAMADLSEVTDRMRDQAFRQASKMTHEYLAGDKDLCLKSRFIWWLFLNQYLFAVSKISVIPMPWQKYPLDDKAISLLESFKKAKKMESEAADKISTWIAESESYFLFPRPNLPVDYIYKWVIGFKEVYLVRDGNISEIPEPPQQLKYILYDCATGDYREAQINIGNRSIQQAIDQLLKSEVIIVDGTPTFKKPKYFTHRTWFFPVRDIEVKLISRQNGLFWFLIDNQTKSQVEELVVLDFCNIKNYISDSLGESFFDFSNRIVASYDLEKDVFDTENQVKMAFFLKHIPIEHRIAFLRDFTLDHVVLSPTGRLQNAVMRRLSSASTLNPKVSIDRDNWAVTLISVGSKSDPTTWGGHAEIVIEKFVNGQLVIDVAHLTFSGVHYLENVRQEDLKKLLQRKSPTWLLSRRNVGDMIKEMRWEERMQEKGAKPIEFFLGGRDSLFRKNGPLATIFSKPSLSNPINLAPVVFGEPLVDGDFARMPSNDVDNCITWARAKLLLAGVKLPSNFVDGFITMPKMYTDSVNESHLQDAFQIIKDVSDEEQMRDTSFENLSQGTSVVKVENPDLARARYKAYCACQLGKFKEAIQIFSKLVLEWPVDMDCWKGLAGAYQSDNQLIDALRAWENVAKIDDKDPSPHYCSAQCLILLGDKANALEALERAEQRSQNNEEQLRFIAQLRVKCLSKKNLEDDIIFSAVPDRLTISNAHPPQPSEQHPPTHIEKSSQVNSHVAIFREPISKMTKVFDTIKDRETMIATGMAAIDEGQPEQAIQIFSHLVADDPSVFDSWLALAVAYQEAKQFAKALDTWTKAIQIDDTNPNPYIGSARCLLRLQRGQNEILTALARAEKRVKNDDKFLMNKIAQLRAESMGMAANGVILVESLDADPINENKVRRSEADKNSLPPQPENQNSSRNCIIL